jgi:mannosyltransferase
MVTGELADSPAPRPAAAGRLGERARLERWPRAAALVVAALTLVGIAVRLVVAHQSLFGDELSTYWIVATHGLHGTLSLLYSTASIHHAEITPPLTFVLSWFSVQLGHSPELLRLPALIAGALTIPVMYVLGLRTVGRAAALVATALTALSPFMIYYSTEARAYGVMVLLVIVSTLAMLRAVETSKTRWWVLYAVASCAALYSHYTCAFVLATQFAWLWWAQPAARRAAVVANAGVVIGFLPWLPGLREDLNSPTVNILSALSPWNAHVVPTIVGHWAIGYPYADYVPLTRLPGTVELVLLAIATLLALAGVALRFSRARLRALDRRVVLVVALALATPVGEAIVSSLSTHLFGVRNLAASWPALALSFSLVVTVIGPPFAIAAVSTAIAAFAIGAARMLSAPNERPNYAAAAGFIADTQQPGDVVIDTTGGVSPGPLTPLDLTLRRRVAIVRAESPAERDHPWGFSDPIVSLPSAIRQAVALAHGGRIFLVTTTAPHTNIAQLRQRFAPATTRLPSPYKIVAVRDYSGIVHVVVRLYARS